MIRITTFYEDSITGLRKQSTIQINTDIKENNKITDEELNHVIRLCGSDLSDQIIEHFSNGENKDV